MNKLENRREETVIKDKFLATIEVTDYYGIKTREVELIVDRGKLPTIGNYIDLFREKYELETEIKDIPMMEFRVKNPEPKGIRMLRARRLVKDYTYTPVTKI
ncbi:hypothetical protein NDS46_31845 (plasmid) [Paenibacillus thiaminolyticus]|uniref:hypothetical protein n=1 Tax=Paenibacillus thiaminolyticus TaxID=49283 RepID=UPI00232B381A|nr:hypothetical protein [Paenibacillus thiaminolyticus]WCF11552.1 hypothetical protein NDS46_31845 [Paenibacillus thiaminolyticus]